MKRIYTHIPQPERRDAAPPGGRARTAAHLARQVASSLAYLCLAGIRGGPGIAMHVRAVRFLARIAAQGGASSRQRAVAMLSFPMDSVRYFEFDFAWRHTASLRAGRYIDVSSPRLFPLSLLADRPAVLADLVNPDGRDLDVTRELIESAGFAERCTLHQKTVENLNFPSGSVDVVTSLSVLEHIPSPRDAGAAARLWSFVRPGGRLVITVPVAREALDEYLDIDDYGLLPASRDGWTFGQRIYDAALLRETFFDALGEPVAIEIFGERRSGTFVADRAAKAAGRAIPWREPFTVAAEYDRFPSTEALPGWGVAGLVFVKPS